MPWRASPPEWPHEAQSAAGGDARRETEAAPGASVAEDESGTKAPELARFEAALAPEAVPEVASAALSELTGLLRAGEASGRALLLLASAAAREGHAEEACRREAILALVDDAADRGGPTLRAFRRLYTRSGEGTRRLILDRVRSARGPQLASLVAWLETDPYLGEEDRAALARIQEFSSPRALFGTAAGGRRAP